MVPQKAVVGPFFTPWEEGRAAPFNLAAVWCSETPQRWPKQRRFSRLSIRQGTKALPLGRGVDASHFHVVSMRVLPKDWIDHLPLVVTVLS